MRKALVTDAFRVLLMRLDLFLVASRLIKRRSLSQEFCSKGLVKVNEIEAKSSKELKSGDKIEIKRRNEILTVRALKIPEIKQVSKIDASSLFDVISIERLEEED
jgi:ribosomal 50S subunit-recycling heat shock protein